MSITDDYQRSMECHAVDIPLEEIYADSDFNCRGAFISEDVAELANDIRERGVQQPIIVQVWDEDGYKFRIVAGHRRFAACKRINRKTIPAIIKEHVSEVEARAINLIENMQRKDLNILQEAKALESLRDAGLKQEAMGDYLGVTTGWIQPRLWLLDLPQEIQLEAAAGILNTTHIREIHRLPLISMMREAVIKIKEAKSRGEKISVAPKKKEKLGERRSVRATTELVRIQTVIREALGNGLATRVIAWATGQINDSEMYESIKQEADKLGINYTIPEEYLVAQEPTGLPS